MIFGGQSQGAGMAAWIGKHYPVDRVCMFGGPWDWYYNAATPPAPLIASWMYIVDNPYNTASSKFYGMSHQNDSWGISNLSTLWNALGMGTTSATALYTSPSGQKLRTEDTSGGCSTNPHACSVKDGVTPMDSGVPRYDDAWLYLCDIHYGE
jgi:hypothetical protein